MPETADKELRLGPAEGARIAVFGAGGGIGQVLVKELLARQSVVFAVDTADALVSLPRHERLSTHRVDALDDDSIGKALSWLEERAPVLDGYVNLIGFMLPSDGVTETPVHEWDEVLDGNLRSAYLFARRVVPLLRRGTDSALVHVSSALGVNTRAGYGHYAAAKAGLIALTKAIAREEAPQVRANSVAPSAVDTPFLRGGTGRSVTAPRDDRAKYIQGIPMERIAEPADVVGPILFLLGTASAYVNGETLMITGGGYVR